VSSLLALLRDNRNYRWLISALAVSLFGDWFGLIAVFTLLDTHGISSASVLGWVIVIRQLPIVLAAPLAGVVADRMNRRNILILSDLARFALTLLLLTPWASSVNFVYLVLVLMAIASAFFEPARQALTPDLMEREHLTTAAALGSIMWSIMIVLGSAVGGLVTEMFGWQAALVVDAATFLLSAAMTVRIHLPATSPHASQEQNQDSRSLGEFLAIVRADPQLRALITFKGWYGIGGAIFMLLPLFGQQVYRIGGNGALGISLLYVSRGLGALVGPLVARAWARGDPTRIRHCLTCAYPLLIAAYTLLGCSGSYEAVVTLVFFTHAAASILYVFSTLLLQLSTDGAMRGRAFGLDFALFTLTNSVSTILFGYLIDAHILNPHSAAVTVGLMWVLPFCLWLYRQRCFSRPAPSRSVPPLP